MNQLEILRSRAYRALNELYPNDLHSKSDILLMMNTLSIQDSRIELTNIKEKLYEIKEKLPAK